MQVDEPKLETRVEIINATDHDIYVDPDALMQKTGKCSQCQKIRRIKYLTAFRGLAPRIYYFCDSYCAEAWFHKVNYGTWTDVMRTEKRY
jgi:hypothetical protein